jgi:hypothetical protein
LAMELSMRQKKNFGRFYTNFITLGFFLAGYILYDMECAYKLIQRIITYSP